MPALDLASVQTPPAIFRQVTQSEADKALAALKSRQFGTPFQGAKPSKVPGLVTILLPDGRVAYSDISGRFYIVGMVFDLATGEALDGALDGQPTEN